MGPIMGGRPLVRYTAALTNVVCNGDSLTSGQGASNESTMSYPKQMQLLSPINNQLVVVNTGIGGTNANTWLANHASVDAAYVPGKINVLTVDMGTNGAVSSMGDYIAALLAVHPDWKIAICTMIPKGLSSTQPGRDADNASLIASNDYYKANYKAWGAKMLIDMRLPGSPFAFADYQLATFTASGLYNLVDFTHLNDAGYAAKAVIVANALRRMPLR